MATLNIGGQRVKVDDSFLSMTPEQQQATVDEISTSLPKQPTFGETALDAAKGFGSGAVKGAVGMAGIVGDLNKLVGSGFDQFNRHVLGWSEEKIASRNQLADQKRWLQPTSGEIRTSVENNVTGPLYEPKTRTGRYAENIGAFLPAAIAGPGGIGRRVVMQAAVPAIAAEAAGQATEGTAYEPYARFGAAMAAPAAVSMARRLVTPLPAPPDRLAAVAALRKEGVTSLTAGQKTGSKALQYAESILGDAPGAGGKTSKIIEEGQRQFTNAAVKRAGAAGLANPETLASNYARLQGNYRDLAARNNLVFDTKFGRDLIKASDKYARVPPSQQKAIVEGYFQDILDHATNTGGMSGTYYQEMRSMLSRQSNALRNADPTLSQTLRDIKVALDDNMGRVISPADKALWKTTNRQYAAQKILEKTASRAGEAAAEGSISPANLRNAVAVGANRGQYARGEGDFAKLARSGNQIMTPLPNSGTAQRTVAAGIPAALGSGATLLATGAAPVAAMSALAAGAAPAVAGRALMSRPMQAYFTNQLLGPPPTDAREIARLLLLSRSAEPLIATQPRQRVDQARQ